MHAKLLVLLLLWETFDISHTDALKSKQVIQNICDTLHADTNLPFADQQQWESICHELIYSKDDDQYAREQYKTMNEKTVPRNIQSFKIRGGGIRIGGSRGGGIRTGGSRRSGSRTGGSRSPSVTNYRNTRTGASISRPNGWLWSRARVAFLPLAIRYGHRSRSSSNRYTTPSASSLTYYYCTSNTNSSVEIQCSSANGDSQCCEDTSSGRAFCCGGDIPSYITQDMSKATRAIAKLFYTLAALAFCVHLFMRRFFP